MQVGTYPTRNFATFGPSELQPPFTGASIQSPSSSSWPCRTGQVSVPILFLSNLQRLVFLLNSRYSQLCANNNSLRFYCYSFSRSYRANLPSSFNIFLSYALVYSTHSPVSVYSTVFCIKSYFLRFLFCFFYSNTKKQNEILNLSLFITPSNFAFAKILRDRLTHCFLKIAMKTLNFRRQLIKTPNKFLWFVLRYSCQYSRFWYLQKISRSFF